MHQINLNQLRGLPQNPFPRKTINDILCEHDYWNSEQHSVTLYTFALHFEFRILQFTILHDKTFHECRF